MFIEAHTADGGTVLLAASNITTAQRKLGSETGKDSITVNFVGGPPFAIELDNGDAASLWQSIKDSLG
jgi:hypothetical protein